MAVALLAVVVGLLQPITYWHVTFQPRLQSAFQRFPALPVLAGKRH